MSYDRVETGSRPMGGQVRKSVQSHSISGATGWGNRTLNFSRAVVGTKYPRGLSHARRERIVLFVWLLALIVELTCCSPRNSQNRSFTGTRRLKFGLSCSCQNLRQPVGVPETGPSRLKKNYLKRGVLQAASTRR